MPPTHRHPYFDDRAAVDWSPSIEEGTQAALAAGRRLLVVVTLPECGGSRALIERVFPKEEIFEELRNGFVCVSADARTLDAQTAALMALAPRKEPTPVCLYAAPEAGGLRLVFSTAGGRPPAVFLRDLAEAHTKR